MCLTYPVLPLARLQFQEWLGEEGLSTRLLPSRQPSEGRGSPQARPGAPRRAPAIHIAVRINLNPGTSPLPSLEPRTCLSGSLTKT